MKLFKNSRLFQLALYLIALHSFLVGLALIVLPFGVLSWFGFTIDPYRFFSTQGGVFHIVMSLAYYLAGRTPLMEKSLLLFIISAKWMAFFFLAAYYLFIEMVPVIAFSAVSDGLMGFIVMMFFLELYSTEEKIVV
ncbi:MAG: hypothetical protein HQ507_09310 [Candidatus Marinimicrobia bacterium]|nr:hypothetical protein [Candidatus Neomarinimicrobiota bacterium]